MSVYKPKGSPFYHFDFRFKGDRFFGSTEETDRRRAETVEKGHKDRARAENKKGKHPGQMTFDEAAGRYWDEVARHKASSSEIESNLERLVAIVGRETLIIEIDDEKVARYVAARRAAKRWNRAHTKDGTANRFVSAATVNRQVTQLLRPILLRARDTWKIALPNMPDWGSHLLKEPRERTRELRVDEEASIEAIERGDYRPVRLFAQITGLRLREVVGLTWPQVDLWNRTISVVGKGDKPHVVPMTEELRLILEPLRAHHPNRVFTYVAERTYRNAKADQTFVKGERYPITRSGLTSRRKRDFEKAGVKDLRWHDFRHTAASRLVRATGSLKTAKELLGHSDIRTTDKYAHVNQADVRRAMEAASNQQAAARSPEQNPGMTIRKRETRAKTKARR